MAGRPFSHPFPIAPLLLAASLSGCGSCADGGRATEAEGARVWGRDKIRADVAARAGEPIDARSLNDPELRRRVLGMSLEEIGARIGALTYSGQSRFWVERRGNHIEIYEDTRIEMNTQGEWRVTQRDEDGRLMREKYAVHGLFYVRNGKGKLRTQGVADEPGGKTLSQAFSPLSHFTGWFGDRLDLVPDGSGLVEGRSVVGYRFRLGPGPDLIEDPNRPGKKLRPRKLSGRLQVDADTGAPLAVALRGRIDVAPPSEASQWGRLEVELDAKIGPRADTPIVVPESVPPIARRPVDLDPLGFLEGATRTSTVIGGR